MNATGERELSEERPVSTIPQSQLNTLRQNKSGSVIHSGGGVPNDKLIIYVNQTI